MLAGDPVAERIELVAGDMFESVPPGCDLYLLLAVVHDWDDELAGRVLANVADRLGPDGRALVVESVVPTRPGNDFSITTDVLMLVLTGSGRERTVDEFAALFAVAGLRVDARPGAAQPVPRLRARARVKSGSTAGWGQVAGGAGAERRLKKARQSDAATLAISSWLSRSTAWGTRSAMRRRSM